MSEISVQDPFNKLETKGGKILKKKISELCHSYGVKFDYPASSKSESGISDTSSEGEDPALKKRVDSDDDSCDEV